MFFAIFCRDFLLSLVIVLCGWLREFADAQFSVDPKVEITIALDFILLS